MNMSEEIFNAAVTLSMIGSGSFKPYEKLDFSDDFMFGKVMQDKERCKKLGGMRLHLAPDTEIEDPLTQGSIRNSPASKSIFLDVRTRDASSFYDVEMQKRVDKTLPLRMRYYQSMMDIEFLQKGHEYGELLNNYILFFCKGDLFGKGKPVYTFTTQCEECKELVFGDKATKIVYNASKWMDVKDRELSALLRLIHEGEATTGYTSELEHCIRQMRNNPMWRKEYMDYHMEIMHEANIAREEARQEARREALAEGISQGRAAERIDTVIALMKTGVQAGVIAKALNISEEEVLSMARMPPSSV